MGLQLPALLHAPGRSGPSVGLSLALVAALSLGLLIWTNSAHTTATLVRQSLTSPGRRCERKVRQAIDDTAAAARVRVEKVNSNWDPETAYEDGRYKLGSLSLEEYKDELRSNWTSLVDSPAANPSLEAIARRMLVRLELSASSAQQRERDLPKTIWSTAANGDEPVAQFQHWTTHNHDEGWSVRKLDDDGLETWIVRTFGAESELAKRFLRLPLKVLQSDMFRYLVLLVEGGVWGDSDTGATKPISRWGEGYVDGTDGALAAHQAHLNQLWNMLDRSSSTPVKPHHAYSARQAEEELPPPALIVAIELASSHAHDEVPNPWWVDNAFARRIQFTQWAFAAQPGHPVLWDVLSRAFAIQSAIEAGELERQDVGVLEWTGPGVFTDAVMRYLKARWAFDYEVLVGMKKPLRVGDVLILPDRAFQAYASEPNEVEANSPEACVWHGFGGRWKGQTWRRRARRLR